MAESSGGNLYAELAAQDRRCRIARLPRDAMRTAESLGRSLMPDGLLAPLDDQQVRDLLAYLQALQ